MGKILALCRKKALAMKDIHVDMVDTLTDMVPFCKNVQL